MTVKCSSTACPKAQECYFFLALEDPIDQKYKDYYTGKEECEHFEQWAVQGEKKRARNK